LTTARDRLRFIEPDGSNLDEVRQLGYRFIDLLVEAAAKAGSHPPVPEELPVPDLLRGPYTPSLEGRDPYELIEIVRTEILDRTLNPAHPGYVGHMDSLASAVGIFSDALISACNNNMLSYEMSLVFTAMEDRLLRWATGAFGWGDAARGLLVSGGTLANIQAIWVARNHVGDRGAAREGLASPEGRLVLLASEHAHYSFLKAANLLGIGRRGAVLVQSGDSHRIDPRVLEEVILRARGEGLRPFCVVGVAGTTVTGTIEPLDEIGAIARRHGLWFHVDAAYGGSLILSKKLRSRLRGCETADSITWNPQKWLYVPKTCASILFRDGQILETTVREPFLYGREGGDDSHPNLGEYTIQGTRRVDVLKLWLTLEHLGTDYMARLIETQVEAASRLADRIEATPGLELIARPNLNIVCFRAIPPGIDPTADPGLMDEAQSAVQLEVARRGHGWLSMPLYRGRRVLRAVILHPRCDDSLLDLLLKDVLAASREARA